MLPNSNFLYYFVLEFKALIADMNGQQYFGDL